MASPILVLSRRFSTSHIVTGAIKNISVIGGGLMGSGIAQVAAQTGHNVTLVDVNDAAIKQASASINGNVQRIAKKMFKDQHEEGNKFIQETLNNLNFSLDLSSATKSSDLVIEAIVENISAKHELFSKIDSISPDNAIFASNTSSIPITDIASVTNRKDRFVGLHFFNPVPIMKLLEIIRTSDTSDDTYEKVSEWGKTLGKVTITCKDTPGFVVNRLLVPLLCEAIRMVERGDATPKDIDIALKLGAGHPMGPIELADYVGHDTTKSIIEVFKSKYPDNPLFEPLNALNELVKQGKLGVKSGEGFYKYEKKK